jgi:pyruvate,water dikinase
VRSSAVGEDGALSFAGQFESVLHVPRESLDAAYARVVASRWADRALTYRLLASFSEAETPMAVLFLPMLEARKAGVCYTRDPRDPSAERMLVNAVAGLADKLVSGSAVGAEIVVDRREPHTATAAAPPAEAPAGAESGLTADEAAGLAHAALRVEAYFGAAQDIEWVVGGDGRVAVVQARPLSLAPPAPATEAAAPAAHPLLRGGITVFPGRAIGPLHRADTPDDFHGVPDGAVLLVAQATPEIAAVLPSVAAVVAERGNAAGHAATLIREFRLPAVFGMVVPRDAAADGATVSLDAGGCRLYAGAAWTPAKGGPRRHALPARARREPDVVHERILALNLVDPLAASFRASRCRSVHDIVRFAHERAVAAMFRLGDEAAGTGPRRVWRLASPVPLSLLVLDLGGAVPAHASRRSVTPEEVVSAPFQALWRGITAPGVSWAGRVHVSVSGFGSVLSASLTDAWAGMRALGEQNYLLLAPDYLNLNARIGYHFTMIDGLVTGAPENNFVNFRFRGGAAGTVRRDLRARFLADVLRRSGFSVDRRGDLVTAWMRRFPREACERGLTLLGSLMGCARQLDMLVADEAAVAHFVDRYLAGDYQAFA